MFVEVQRISYKFVRAKVEKKFFSIFLMKSNDFDFRVYILTRVSNLSPNCKKKPKSTESYISKLNIFRESKFTLLPQQPQIVNTHFSHLMLARTFNTCAEKKISHDLDLTFISILQPSLTSCNTRVFI